MASDTPDVLIVGAGPTGLTLACLLARSGVGFRIVDASPEAPRGSRGKGLQPRSLELFDDLGIVERIIGNGAFRLPNRMHDDTGAFRDEDLYQNRPPRPDAPYMTPLLIPQFRVEEALRARLEELGGRVEFGRELTGFVQDSDSVTADVAGADGPTQIRARWLVGCDGGHSKTRHLAGIAFLGETMEAYRMLVADVRVAGLDRDHWHMWRGAEGFLALCPLPSTDRFQFQASVGPNQESETTLEVCQRMVDRRAGREGIVLSHPSWMSLWRCNIRMVDRYRAGRVFLAGDAAHVHSPAGGQGMNTGVQDAYNLAWKLTAAIGGADVGLLDTYQAERLPIAASVLGLSTEMLNAAVAAGSIAFRRDAKTTQLGLNYRTSSLALDMRGEGEGLRAGDRAPEAPGLVGPTGSCRMFDLLRGPRATLLGFGAQWAPLIEACKARFGDRLNGYVLVGAAGDPTHFVDAAGHARAAYGDDALFVIRPDNYLGVVTTATGLDSIVAYLKMFLPEIWLGSTGPEA